ncbi:MAG: AraC family transcriptional regulator [Myxococcales bacterium]|nr:AraC family transcriptional regulator [Myxococcales bacterium]
MASQDKLEQTRPSGHGRARGLVSRPSGPGVRARFYRAPEDLREMVERFWVGEWDLPAEAPHETQLLGDPCAHVVFERGDHTGEPERRLVGVWTKLWRRRLEGRGRVRAAKLRAGAFGALFAGAAARFSDRIVPLDDALDGALDIALEDDVALAAELDALQAVVLDADDDEPAFVALAQWLRARRRTDRREHVSLAVALVERIASDHEIRSVQRLGEASGLDPRSLQRLFREHVGASPKWVIRRSRLQEAAARIERGEAPNLAQLAAALGYSDQAHLARDFKTAVGRSPSAFRRQGG